MKKVYENLGVELWCGDCREYPFNPATIVVTDPPYKIGGFKQIKNFTDKETGKGKGKDGASELGRDYHTDFDDEAIEPKEWASLMPDTVVSFFGAKSMGKLIRAFERAGFQIVQDFHFCKTMAPPPLRGVGFAWATESGYIFKRKGSKYRINKEAGYSPNWIVSSVRANVMKKDANKGALTDHPTSKPLGVMRWLVRYIVPKDVTVVDPFCGVGSTGEACIELGRKFVGIEKQVKYCDEAARLFDFAIDRRKSSFHILD